ncbi:MAG: RodZ domain-containing protein [Bryobacteraceae bacterium]
MEKRTDDRFPVQSRAVVILLNDPSHPLDALLADVSASGLRLIVSKDLGEGTEILVELESNIALAEVRYLNPRGDKFVLGARKLATIPRVDLPENATWEQKLERLTGSPVAPPYDPVAQAETTTADAETTPPVASLMPDLKISIPLPVRPEPARCRVAVESIAEPHAPVALQSSHLDVAPADVAAPVPTHMADPQPEQLPDIREYMRAIQSPQISEGTAVAQNDVDGKHQNRSRLGIIAAAAVACLLAVAAAGFYWHPAQGSSNKTPVPKAAQGNVHSAASSTPEKTAATTPMPDPAAKSAAAPIASAAKPAAATASTSAAAITSASTSSAHQASLHATSITWVAVCTDTKEQVRKLMQDGDHFNFSFDQKAVVRLGSSGASELTVDGKSIGPLGPLGSPRVLLVKPVGFEYVAGLPADGSGDCPSR